MSECLPAPVAALSAAAEKAIGELSAVRTGPLSGEEVAALAVVWHRLTGQVETARLAVLAAIEARSDVVPRSRGSQAAAFGQHALGLGRSAARREARDAGLLCVERGDLRCLGAAFGQGAVLRGHVDVAVRTHKALGAARDALVTAEALHTMAAELEVDLNADVAPGHASTRGIEPPPVGETTTESQVTHGSVLDGLLNEAERGGLRQVLVVDAVLALYARRLSVPEFDAVARRLVHHLNPPSDRRAHEQRFLHMSSTFDGSWVGRFSCGAAQGALLKRVLGALSAPRPGLAIDADGVQRVLPDERDLGARQMDALMELIAVAVAAHGTGTGTPPDRDRATGPAPDGASSEAAAGDTSTSRADSGQAVDGGSGQAAEAGSGGVGPGAATSGERGPVPPAQEGEFTVIRAAGVLAAPFPDTDLVLVVGIEHLAAARALHLTAATYGPDPEPDPEHDPEHDPQRRHDRGRAHGEDQGAASSGGERSHPGRARSPVAAALDSFRRTATPPDLGAAGPLDDTTLALLVCSAALRSVLLAPSGGVLDLGRSQRLAGPAQRRALRARDGGCVVPACSVPAEGCHAHHVISWQDGGPTDLHNLVLVCARHHTEIHHGTWTIIMIDGVPWVRPPAWIDRTRPLLRNAVHHGLTRPA